MNIDKLKELKSKATPGRWKYAPGEEHSIYGNGFRISVTNSGEATRDKANAQLICEAVNNLDALLEAVGVLENVKQACLFSDDDGGIGITTEPHIPEELFDNICSSLAKLEE
jgi:hypothetical protein